MGGEEEEDLESLLWLASAKGGAGRSGGKAESAAAAGAAPAGVAPASAAAARPSQRGSAKQLGAGSRDSSFSELAGSSN